MINIQWIFYEKCNASQNNTLLWIWSRRCPIIEEHDVLLLSIKLPFVNYNVKDFTFYFYSMFIDLLDSLCIIIIIMKFTSWANECYLISLLQYMQVNDKGIKKKSEVEIFNVPTRKKAVPAILSLTSKIITQ